MMVASPLQLSIVVVTWNCWEHLQRCLGSLPSDVADIPHEIIIVDNGSTDGAASHVREQMPQVQVVEMGRNAGFAAAANRGLGRARGEFVWLLNPDTVICAGAATTLMDALRRLPHAGAAGPRLLRVDGSTDPLSARKYPTILSEALEKAGLRRHAERLTRIDLSGDGPHFAPSISGAAACFRREALRQVGGLDAAFFLYAEDLDICRRLQRGGWEIYYCGDASVVHLGGGSSAACAEGAGIEAILSMVRYFGKYAGGGAAFAYRCMMMGFSVLKMAAYSTLAVLSTVPQRRQAAMRKVRLHRRLLRALWSGRNNVAADPCVCLPAVGADLCVCPPEEDLRW